MSWDSSDWGSQESSWARSIDGDSANSVRAGNRDAVIRM
jgi:hypothetical protein